MKPCIYFKSNFFKKITVIFLSGLKENSYQLQNTLKNSNIYTKVVNYNEELYNN